ncbi:MAG: ANTAR domain-containing protein [Ruminococcaceae bacterium]|nr:ANTAR domain-containing protein [Oscillospiraceae bacterium]
MSLEKHAYSVLVVSSAENFGSAVSSMLPKGVFGSVSTAKSISAAQREVAERDFDFIIINAPVKDDLGIRFAIDSNSAGNTIVLLLIQNEIHGEVYERVVPHGVFTLPKPISKPAMDNAIRWMVSAKAKLGKYEKKSVSIEDKMQEIRLINKAKWLLITAENMTEPDAHRYLEKEAMDRCISKKEVAESIINKHR